MISEHRDKAWFAEKLASASRARPSLELRDFFASLKYAAVHEVLSAGLVDSDETRAHAERIITMIEAAKAIPAINEANLGAVAATADGRLDNASRLHSQTHLLTAMFRIAEDMGYEW